MYLSTYMQSSDWMSVHKPLFAGRFSTAKTSRLCFSPCPSDHACPQLLKYFCTFRRTVLSNTHTYTHGQGIQSAGTVSAPPCNPGKISLWDGRKYEG